MFDIMIFSTRICNFASHQNLRPVISKIVVENSGAAAVDAQLRITTDPAKLSIPLTIPVSVKANSRVTVTNIDLQLSADYLVSLTERISGTIVAELLHGDTVLCTSQGELTVQPVSAWGGLANDPELLAAYVTPNHGVVRKLLEEASNILEKRTGSPSIKGYSGDSDRPYQTAAAIYEAIKAQCIVYAASAPHFEEQGQRVRLAHEMMACKQGNCLDLTLLYCSCLEAAKLNPIIITVPGHAFAGFWLEEKNFPKPVHEDISAITQRLDAGNRKIVVVECTSMCESSTSSFEAAQQSARDTLAEKGSARVIDVKAARAHARITPLPVCLTPENTYIFAAGAPAEKPHAISEPVIDQCELKTYDKKGQWESRLSQLNFRNSLLNISPNRSTIVPLHCDDAVALGQMLRTKADFELVAKVYDENLPNSDENDRKNKRIRTKLDQKELMKRAANLAKLGKESLNETGANSIFLSLGALNFVDIKSGETHAAPLILLPAEIRRVGTVFKLHLTEDEAMLNVSLLEKLRLDYSLLLPVWDEIPLDATGSVDVERILASMRTAINGQVGWTVTEMATIGQFGYADMVLWKDIHDHFPVMCENPVVSGLVTGVYTPNGNEEGETDNLHLPIVADSSQRDAIRAFEQNETMVLHGPPGTGKTNVISGMVASALRDHKKVLVVTEKKAALDAVHVRLKKLGLDRYCLEMHSNKANKQDVLSHLGKVIAHVKEKPTAVTATITADAAAPAKELAGYGKALHEPRHYGCSLYALIEKYENVPASTQHFDADRLPEAQSMTAEMMQEQTSLMQQLGIMANALHPHKHPLQQVRCTSFEGADSVTDYKQALDQFEASAKNFAQSFNIPTSYTDYDRLVALAMALQQWLRCSPEYFDDVERLDSAMHPLHVLCSSAVNTIALRKELLAKWDEGFLDLDARKWLNHFEAAENGPVLLRSVRLMHVTTKLTPLLKVSMEPQRLGGELERLDLYQHRLAATQALLRKQEGTLSAAFGDQPYDFEAIGNTLNRMDKIATDILHLMGSKKAALHVRNYARSFETEINALVNAWDIVSAEKKRFVNSFRMEHTSLEGNFVETEKALVAETQENLGSMRDWTAWNKLCAMACNTGLEVVVEALSKGEDPTDTCNGYWKGVYRKLIRHTIASEPSLSDFSGVAFATAIAQMKNADSQQRQAALALVCANAHRHAKDAVTLAQETGDLTALNKAIDTKCKGVSLRKLFHQFPEVIMDMCPVLLMSPGTVAQLLPMVPGLVDYVIFDEASQIPTCRAVGALARGKHAIIVGDPKQMPPTNFFASERPISDDFLTEDMESILDDVLAMGVQSKYLRFHYRSHHESLIAFSNRHFYENSLYTFPAAHDRNSHVKLHFVGGTFDRGESRTNRAEAEAIIQELKNRSARNDNHSVGIIAFNIQQQRLIEELLSQAMMDDGVLCDWLETAKEPLFIKNLENAQGDERDVILLCVGYGPDAEGNLTMNFGPLNKESGWRRLNVAVSRARDEMMVFSSLRSSQIDLNRTESRGVAALQAFLAFAEGHGMTDSPAVANNDADGIAQTICSKLREAGFEAIANLGFSNRKVDVAVIDPQHPGQYLMGILMDSAYSNETDIRDRELTQVGTLENLGWELHRVWSVNFFANPDYEMKVILQHLHKLMDATT